MINCSQCGRAASLDSGGYCGSCAEIAEALDDWSGKNSAYTVTAGSNSTGLGVVGNAKTMLAAKRIGRQAVRSSLPNGEGSYCVKVDGYTVASGERSIRTGFKWHEMEENQ